MRKTTSTPITGPHCVVLKHSKKSALILHEGDRINVPYLLLASVKKYSEFIS
jgi:hypothetical protein